MGIEQSSSIGSLSQSAIIKPAKKVLFEDEFSSTSLAGKNLLKNPYSQLDYNPATNYPSKIDENRAIQKSLVSEEKLERMKDIEEFLLRNSEREDYDEMALNQYQANLQIKKNEKLRVESQEAEEKQNNYGGMQEDLTTHTYDVSNTLLRKEVD